MKIRSMTATFGKLDHARLELGDGLNLIYAPNEGGKSTWAAFWKAMLYGIDTRDRDKKGYLADKNRYQPWSGAPMEGTMDLEWQGRDITLRRGPKGSAPFGAFSAVYTGTEEAVPGLTAANCGELLTGVGRPSLDRVETWRLQRPRSWSGVLPRWCPPGRRTCPTPRPRGGCGSGSTAERSTEAWG